MENIVAAFTPFLNDEKQSVNYDVIPKYAEYLKAQGLNYVLLNGSTGEHSHLTPSERKQVVKVWMKECQKLGLRTMVQVGGTNLTTVRDLAMHAAAIGANSLLCLPEMYFRPGNADQLAIYYERICAMVPNVPVFMYYNPNRTHVSVPLVEFLKKMEPVKNFAGLKYAADGMIEPTDIVSMWKDRYQILCPYDQLIVPACAVGFHGFNTTALNIFPKRIFKVQELFAKGDLQAARNAQAELNRAIEGVTKHGFWLQSMKAAFNIVAPFSVGQPRLPVLPLEPDVVEKIKQNLTVE